MEIAIVLDNEFYLTIVRTCMYSCIEYKMLNFILYTDRITKMFASEKL